VGQALTKALYGKSPRYSYFVGGSTGGRQGLMEAQRYPQDYDGIVSACPAINWHRFLPADLWPQVVMVAAKNFMSKSKLDAATSAAVAACDALDGHRRRHRRSTQCHDPKRCWNQGSAAFTETGGCGAQDLGGSATDGTFLWHVWRAAMELRARQHSRFADEGKALHHFSGLVPILFDPESAVGLDNADASGI
jgi:feruloyl esterase